MKAPSDRVSELIEGFRNTALIATAVKLKIIDALDGNARRPGELAAELRFEESALTRILRGLAVLELVEEQADSGDAIIRYGLTPAGRELRSGPGGRLASYALLCGSQYLPAWAQMNCALEASQNPFESAFGQSVWNYRRDNPEAGRLFNEWLHGQSATVIDEIVAALDFSSGQQVCDLAGGKGILLAGILQKFPGCRGVLAEQPSHLELAESYLRECGLQERCEFVPTDFFGSLPGGCDVYLLKSVLHDWDDAQAIRILESLRQARSHGARLYIIERLLPRLAREDPATIWIDLMMMNVTGGRERSLQEYKDLLRRAGLPPIRSVRPAGPFHLMEVIGR